MDQGGQLPPPIIFHIHLEHIVMLENFKRKKSRENDEISAFGCLFLAKFFALAFENFHVKSYFLSHPFNDCLTTLHAVIE